MLEIEVIRKSNLIDEDTLIRISSPAGSDKLVVRAETADENNHLWSSSEDFVLENGNLDIRLDELIMKMSFERILKRNPFKFSVSAILNLMSRLKNGICRVDKFIKFTSQTQYVDLTVCSKQSGTAGKKIDLHFYPGDKGAELILKPFYGKYYAGSGGKEAPAVIVLGGSAGGFGWSEQVAGVLSGSGINVLALSYFDFRGRGGMPRRLHSIPLEYFDAAVKWLESRAEVDAENIGMIGISKGAEAALMYLSRFSGKIKAAALYVPPSWSFEGVYLGKQGNLASWSLSGEVLPFLPYPKDTVMSMFMKDGYIREIHQRAISEAVSERKTAAAIDISEIGTELLLISGGLDGTWPSREMCRTLCEQRTESRIEHIDYPAAGHVFMLPNIPPFIDGDEVMPEASYKANRDAWGRVKNFLAEKLIRA